MKRLFIWWHRRRAANWDAWQHWHAHHMCSEHQAHITWRDWHLAQVKRLENLNQPASAGESE